MNVGGMSKLLTLILLWCAINTVGEVLIKFGAHRLAPIQLNGFKPILAIIMAILKNPYVLLGTFFCAIDLVVWMYILKNGDLSVVNPLAAINYVFAVGAGVVFFHEVMTFYRLLGVACICAGAYFITR